MESYHTLIRFGAALLLGFVAAKAAAPSFITAPADALGTVGEPFLLSASVAGDDPLAYRWFKDGLAVEGATGNSLAFSRLDITNGGVYQLTVTNAAGSISTNVTLVVSGVAARRVYTGAITADEGIVNVPIRFVPNGIEQGVQFSLAFDTNVMAQPGFEPAIADAVVEPLEFSEEGNRVGVKLHQPGTALFAARDVLLGTFRFPLLPEKSPWDGKLQFATNPVTPAALTLTNSLLLGTNDFPFFRRVDALPELNRQTGLYHQRLDLVNGSGTEFTNVNLLVFGLNPTNFTVHNSVTTQRTDSDFDGDLDLDLGVDCDAGEGVPCEINPDTNGDGTSDPAPLVTLGGIKPGEVRRMFLEYFSKDRSLPHPRFSLQLGAPVTNLVSTRNRLVEITDFALTAENKLGVQFLTTTSNRYFIQYVNSVEDWNNSNKVYTAQPPVQGNGSWVQWIDQGPPKTAPLPTNGVRFYRVREGF